MIVYDAVFCVSPEHKYIALKAIKSLAIFSKAKRIFVITAQNNFVFFYTNLNCESLSLILLDEDDIIEGVDLFFVKKVLEERIGINERAGWYFQQFIKMAVSKEIIDLASFYLLWDSDTLMLDYITFFDSNNRVLINPKKEYHKPYFDVMKKIIGLDKKVNFSFISEHLMINKNYMQELINIIQKNAPENVLWVKFILDSIDDDSLSGSGFSEYEIYGNFISVKYKNSYSCRSLKSTRNGANFYGINPDKYDIFYLTKFNYKIVTFEHWQPSFEFFILINKILAKVFYEVRLFLNKDDLQLKNITQIF